MHAVWPKLFLFRKRITINIFVRASLCCGVLALALAVVLLRRGSQGSEGVVTLGETSVLMEFQISNDILRKR